MPKFRNGSPPRCGRILVTFVAVAVLTGSFVGCGRHGPPAAKPSVEKISIAASSLPGSAAIFVAQDKGFFRDEGLEITVVCYDSGRLALAEMLSGGADVATVGDTPIARAVVEGKPLKVIASLGENTYANAVIARRDRGVVSAQDLKHKRIGRSAWTSADFFLNALLTTSYVDPEGVDLVDFAPSDLANALVTGEVDAISSWAPTSILAAEQLGTNAITLHDPSIYTMTWNITVRPEWATLQPETVRKLLRAVLRSTQFIADYPEVSQAIYARHAHVAPAVATVGWKGWDFNVSLDQSLILDLEDQARWILRRSGSNQPPPNFLEFIYSDALKAVRPDAVRIPGK
jgi:NitT/TauT family transport system substrate-binding protein